MDENVKNRLKRLLYEASCLANNSMEPADGREPKPIDEVVSHIEEAIDWLGNC